MSDHIISCWQLYNTASDEVPIPDHNITPTNKVVRGNDAQRKPWRVITKQSENYTSEWSNNDIRQQIDHSHTTMWNGIPFSYDNTAFTSASSVPSASKMYRVTEKKIPSVSFDTWTDNTASTSASSIQPVPKMYKITERKVPSVSFDTWTDPKTTDVVAGKICGFCRRNGESDAVYKNHSLRSANGDISCPILRGYVCPVCNATGDKAHTITYCPITRRNNFGQTPLSPTIMLKTSRYKSNGQARY